MVQTLRCRISCPHPWLKYVGICIHQVYEISLKIQYGVSSQEVLGATKESQASLYMQITTKHQKYM